MAEPPIPVTLITGFLGSGKTTLLNRILRSHPLTAVVMNEFGETGLDHQLVEGVQGPMALLSGGCLCCQVQGSLAPTLKNLHMGRSEGRLPPYERILIETTGIADPVPILETLRHDRWLAQRYFLDGVISTVDAVLGLSQLEAHHEARRQVAVADRLLVTKGDMADGAALAQLLDHLAELNPSAPVEQVRFGAADMDALLGLGAWNPSEKHPDVLGWLNPTQFKPATRMAPGRMARPAPAASSDHTTRIQAFSLRFEEPLDWQALEAALGMLVDFRGTQLLRMKAIVNVAGRPGPVVLHGAQHVFHPPAELPRWPDDDHASRFVFITDGLEAAMVSRLLEDFTQAARQGLLDTMQPHPAVTGLP